MPMKMPDLIASTLSLRAAVPEESLSRDALAAATGVVQRSHRRWLLPALLLPAVAILGAATLVSIFTATPIADFTRDPADIAHVSPFTGAISNLGILCWSATVGICLLTGLVLRAVRDTPVISRFFLAAAALTTLLLLDDLFLLHEQIFPHYLHLRQRYTYLLYASLTAGFLIAFRAVILQHARTLLVLAFLFFALSVGVDLVADRIATAVPFYHLIEDGAKFLGIISWLGYFGDLAFARVTTLSTLHEHR